MQGLMMDYQLNVPAISAGATSCSATARSSRACPTRAGIATPTPTSRRAPSGSPSRFAGSGSRTAIAWRRSCGTTTSISRRTSERPSADSSRTRSTCGCTRTTTRTSRPTRATACSSPTRCCGRSRRSSSSGCGFEHVIAVGSADTPDGAIDYEELLARADEGAFAYRDIDERSAAAMCYTSGTTGRPKGVVYSHRAIAIHALARRGGPLGMTTADTCLPVVPMFHANAWCFPFTCTLIGAKQVLPGPHLDPVSLLETSSRSGSLSPPACRRSGWAFCRRSTRIPAAGISPRSAR